MGLDWQKDRERKARAALPPLDDDPGYGDWLVRRYNAPSKAELRATATAAYEDWSRRTMPASLNDRHRGPPMDLANMRENGVRHLIVQCRSCRHSASVLADMLPDDELVPSAGRRFRCSACGSRAIDTRPDWSAKTEKPAAR